MMQTEYMYVGNLENVEKNKVNGNNHVHAYHPKLVSVNSLNKFLNTLFIYF